MKTETCILMDEFSRGMSLSGLKKFCHDNCPPEDRDSIRLEINFTTNRLANSVSPVLVMKFDRTGSA